MADGRREEQTNIAERRTNTIYDIPSSFLPFRARTSISLVSLLNGVLHFEMLKEILKKHSMCVPFAYVR